MCEILCRGKTKIGSFWFEGAYVPESKIIIGYFEVVGYNSNEDLMDCKAIARKVLPETVGRYIGLTDKNGVKIFEGDIVKMDGIVYVIIWDNSKAMFFLQSYNPRISTDFYYIFPEDLEVIGNIHDNPELLKAERNGENVDNGR